MWSSRANHPFMSFTIHFVEDWSLKSFCLDTVPMFKDHTGQNICDAFQDILDNWKLDPRKLVATTTDKASNYVSAFQILDWVRVSCFGHNLNLAISKGIGIVSVQRAISRCHSLVEMFNRSWKKCRDLRQKQELLKLPKHKIIAVSVLVFLILSTFSIACFVTQDVSTRWGSTYLMVARIIEQQQAIMCGLTGG